MASEDRPGLKRKDIEKCCLCGLGVAHDGSFTFYRIKLERFLFDPKAIQRRHGLETFFGGGAGGALLAGVMGTDDDLAKSFSDEDVGLICDSCSGTSVFIAQIAERFMNRRATAPLVDEERPHED